MKHLRLAIILCLILLPAVGRAADDGYGYPIPGSYEATILGTRTISNLRPCQDIGQALVLNVIPDLKKPDVFFYDEGLRCTLAYQDRKHAGFPDRRNRLATGLRSHGDDEGVLQAGYHVITCRPHPPNFIISASNSHIPGDLTEDAKDLYG